MARLLAPNLFSPFISKTIDKGLKSQNTNRWKFRCHAHAMLKYQEDLSSRRRFIMCNTMLATALILNTLLARAEDSNDQNVEEEDEGVVGAIKSLFDPNEKTKTGKVLPKAYLNSAKQVIKTLRESLNEDPKDNAKFRRTADAAKESIREYLTDWRGQEKVSKEESYVVLEKAFRSLASFYSKAGPSAPLPEEVKNDILNYLNKAEEFL